MDDLLLLSEICMPYFGLNPEMARRRHALGKLPINAFRLGDSRKGPLYVHKDDLEQLIAKRRAAAAQQQRQLESVQ